MSSQTATACKFDYGVGLFLKTGYYSKMIINFDLSMEAKKEQTIKAQEWVVMFDGQIKRSEKEIDAYQHQLEVNNQKSEQLLGCVFIG